MVNVLVQALFVELLTIILEIVYHASMDTSSKDQPVLFLQALVVLITAEIFLMEFVSSALKVI